MFGLSILALLVCLVGLVRPFANFQRKHFGWGAVGAFVLMLVTTPPSPEKDATGSTSAEANLSPAEAQELEKKNTAEIAKLKHAVSSVPSTDADKNLQIYTRLAQLAPGNPEFANKRLEYQAKIDARARYESNPEEALEITEFDWSKGGFGSIMMIDRLAVRNDAPFPIKDFVLKCVHQGPSGTDLDSNTRRIYEIIPAGKVKTMRELNMGFIHSQAVSSNCEITGAVAA